MFATTSFRARYADGASFEQFLADVSANGELTDENGVVLDLPANGHLST